MLSGEDEAIDDNLTSWEIKSVEAMLISIDLEFESPLLVSSGDLPEQIVV